MCVVCADVVMISGSGSGFSYALSLTVSNGIYVGVDSAKSTVTTPPAMNGGSPTTYIISGIGMGEFAIFMSVDLLD